MGIVLAPIQPSLLQDWKEWNNEVVTSRGDDFKDLNTRMQLTTHRVWLAETPDGPMAAVLHEGPGESEFMQKVAHSDHPFDKWFRESITKFHGVDFSKPPPGPMPELVMSWKAE